MSMMYQVVKKIPGDLPPLTKRENQGYIENLSEKQKFELEDLLQRQNKILANKTFISKLPDKGEKIISFRDKLLKELDYRNEVNNAAALFSELNISSRGKAAMNELEWTGKYTENDENKVIELDSDDEEDPLMILAQPTGSGSHKKKIIRLLPEEKLIKPEDIVEIESFKTVEPLEIEHVKYVINKVEESKKVANRREPFKPYKTTKSNVHDPMKERERKYKQNWEVTAATPPHIIYNTIKTLDLNESLKLQKEYINRLQETQAKHAAERLMEQLGLHNLIQLPGNPGNYRSQETMQSSNSSCSSDDEENELDDDDCDKSGTVVFTVDSIES